MPQTADRGEGTIFGTTLESSGFAVYGRNRVEADPTLIQDTLQMLYYFYEGSVDQMCIRDRSMGSTKPCPNC